MRSDPGAAFPGTPLDAPGRLRRAPRAARRVGRPSRCAAPPGARRHRNPGARGRV